MSVGKWLISVWFIILEASYLVYGIFFVIAFPAVNYLAPMNSLMGKIRFSVSLYSILIGILYLVSGYFISRREKIGLRLAILPNLLGIFLIIPIVLGLSSLYIFTRPQIKEQFK